MKVPFLDLKAQYDSIKDEIDHALKKVLESSAFAGGPFVTRFEKEFAQFCECRYCSGVGSGTEALWLALVSLGVGPGDEVVTTPNTFIATAEAISFCGATPVFVDVDESSFNMDPERLKDFIESGCTLEASSGVLVNKKSKRPVKAIIPVHLYGQMADMDPIMEISKARGIPVVEDASQAHGARYKGRLAGSVGDIGCFSFYPGKNLGAYGEAGAVVTDEEKIIQKVNILKDHGQPAKYLHKAIGWNGRMDGIQGAVLSVKLKYLDTWNEKRRKNALEYMKNLANLDEVSLPGELENFKHVYHVYAVRVQNRDDLIKNLDKNGISSAVHYPKPIHLQEAYGFLDLKRGSFPAAEKCADQIVSLPMYPELTEEQIEWVANTIKNFLNSTGKVNNEHSRAVSSL